MKKIEVITRPEKLVGLKEIFATHNCQGMTCLSVMGCGRQKGDGKVFVTEVLDAMRIRTNERGDDALM